MMSAQPQLATDTPPAPRLFLRTFCQGMIPVLVLLLLFMAIVYGALLPLLEELYLREKRDLCRRLVEVALSDLESRHRETRAGAASIRAAQQRALNRLRAFRFGTHGKDYYFILDAEGKFLMHPYRPDLEGVDPQTMTGPDGTLLRPLLDRMVATARQPDGGFVDYQWHWKDQLGSFMDKTSYVRRFPAWGWTIGTGVYLNDVAAELAVWRRRLINIALLLTGVACCAVMLLSYRTIRLQQREARSAALVQARERQYRLLVETTQDIPYALDTDSCITFIGPQITRYGLSPHTLQGKPFTCLAQQTKEGSASGHEGSVFRLATPDGRQVWLEQAAAQMYATDRTLLGVSGILRDVTHRKQAEDAHHMDEARLEALLRLTDMTDASLDALGNFAMNEAVRLTGSRYGFIAFTSDDEQVLQMHAWSRSGMQDCCMPERPLVYPVAETGLWGEPLRRRSPIIVNAYADADTPAKKGLPGGHVPIHRFACVPVFDGTRIVMIAGVANKDAPYDDTDLRQLVLLMSGMWRILQRRRVEQALRASEEQFRAFFECSPSSIAIINLAAGEFLESNPAFESLIGWPRAEIIGRTAAELGVGAAAWLADLTTRLRTHGQLVQHPATLQTRAGTTVHTLSSAVRIQFHAQDCALCVITDITETKRLEEQLRQAQKMDVVGQMAGGIAHDFNNMLAAIMGGAELLEIDLPPDSGLRAHVTMITEGARRAADLTRKLLVFSRQEKGVTTTMDLHTVIQGAANLLEHSIDRRIRIDLRLEADPSQVDGDPTLLQNVFLNLGLNARDAMPAGGTITITTANITLPPEEIAAAGLRIPAGEYLQIAVADTGTGIKPDILSHVFEPFFTTKPADKGTGLGLAAVYGTITEHRGAIHVASALGRGTTFTVYLPPGRAPAPPNQVSAHLPTNGSGCVLIVDDEPIVRASAAAMLASLGYDTLLAKDGQEALHVFTRERSRISVTLLDMVMPALSGQETFHRIRQIDPQARIVFTSGFNHEARIGTMRDMGAAGFLQKPYQRETLSRAIHAACEDAGFV